MRIDHENTSNQAKYFQECLRDREEKLAAFHDESKVWEHELELLHTKLINETKMKNLTEQNNTKLKLELESIIDSFQDSSKEKLQQELDLIRTKYNELNSKYNNKISEHDILQSQLKFKDIDLKRKKEDHEHISHTLNGEIEFLKKQM